MMNRFYNRALLVLREDHRFAELADDIKDYVNHLEHEKSMLVSELSRANTLGGNGLLESMGYKQVKTEKWGTVTMGPVTRTELSDDIIQGFRATGWVDHYDPY